MHLSFKGTKFNSIHLFSIIKNSKTFKKYAYVHNKMEEVQLEAKAWKCCTPFTNK